jgi:hypothetical protein
MGCHQRVVFKVVLFTMECPGCGLRRDLSPVMEIYVFGSMPSVQSPDQIVFGPDYEDFVIDNQSPDYHG